MIRKARAADAGILSALAMRSKASNGYDRTFMEACREELTVTAGDIEAGEVWLAENNAMCLGFFALAPTGQAGVFEVAMFFIEPDQKRQSVGRRLWHKLEGIARDLQAATLVLDADPNAVPFYRAMGMDVVGTAPSGSIPGRMLPVMSLSLMHR